MKRRTLLQAAALTTSLGAATSRAADPGLSDGEIVLGQTGVLSGPLGIAVSSFLGGAKLAFDEANAQGGVAGRTVRLISLDDELKPDRAVANYEQLLTRDRVFAFFGCVGSATTAAAASLLKSSGAPSIGGYAVADSAREKLKGAGYFVRAGTGREAEVLAQHLTTIGVSRVAVAHLDNPGGVEAQQLIDRALKGAKLATTANAAVKSDGTNLEEAAATITAAPDLQAVIMYLGGPLAGGLMKAVWAQKRQPSFYGMSIVPGEVTAKVAGERTRGLAISQVVPYPWGKVEPQVRSYQALAAKANVPIDYLNFEGYLTAMVTIEAMRRAGRDLTRAKLHQVLRDLKMRIAGMDVDFGNGQNGASRFVELVQVTHEGRFVR